MLQNEETRQLIQQGLKDAKEANNRRMLEGTRYGLRSFMCPDHYKGSIEKVTSAIGENTDKRNEYIARLKEMAGMSEIDIVELVSILNGIRKLDCIEGSCIEKSKPILDQLEDIDGERFNMWNKGFTEKTAIR